MLQFLKDYSQEVKKERKLNCSRAHWWCRKIYETGKYSANQMIRIKIGPTREEASNNSAPDVQ
jgi:hypothetical protein